MSRTLKNGLIFLLMLLPMAAFADSSGLHLFTVPNSDFSVSLLERTFGSVGDVLHGKGNQIVGLLLGIFNAMWVIVIGLGILFVVWDSIMTAAHSGEMMQGRGKKAAFTVIRIVIGFCLVVPSSSTGYSLAQNGVIWVAVQGIGLADEITQKIHDYMQAGGQAFTPKPSSAADVQPLMSIAASILKSEVCMFKVQDFLDQKKKQEDDALKDTGVAPTPPSEFDKMGYSINVGGLAGNVTFGSKNPNYSADDPTTTEYLSECGEAHWQLVIPLPAATESQAASMKKTLAGYMQAAVTEMVINLQPVARELASANLEDTDENATVFQQIAERASTAMAGSGVSYATLLDPLKGAVAITDNQDLKTKLDHLNNSGWIFTPMMVIVPGLYTVGSINLVDFMPFATPPNLVMSEPTGKIKVLTEEQKQQIMDTIAHVDSENYVNLAENYLTLMSGNNEWPTIDFTAMYKGTLNGTYLNNLSSLFDGTRAIMNAGKKAAVSMLEVPKGLMQGIEAIARPFVDGFNIGADNVCIGKVCVDWLNVHIPGVGGDLSGIDDAINNISDLQDSLGDSVNEAIGNLNNLVTDIQAAAPLAEKGGMTTELQALTGQLGPLGPMYATIMTAMIGNSITSFENNVFKDNTNAMVSSIKLGGDMMVGAMKSVFLGGKILFVSTLVQAGINGLSQIVGMIPYVGAPVSGVMDVGTNLVHKGIESFTTFHIALSIMMFAGGLMLYIMVPLTFVVAFAAICLRWVGMVLINVIAAPIFCFNLIRADGEGMAGRGEKFLGDLAKTALTPALLAIGAVAFLIFFNVGFMIITTIFSSFLPILAKANSSPILVPVSLTLILMIFSALMLYIATALSTLCTTEFVNSVTSTIGESIQHLQDSSPAQEIRTRVQEGTQHGTEKLKGMASSGSGIMAKDKQ